MPDINDPLSQVSPQEASAGVSNDLGQLPDIPKIPNPSGQDDISGYESAIDEVIGATKAPPVQEQDQEDLSGYESFVDDVATDNELDGALRASRRQSLKSDKGKANEVLSLHFQSGLPIDFIDRNKDQVREEIEAKQFDPEVFKKESPVFAKWMAENPTHAAAVASEINDMGYMEKQLKYTKNQFNLGTLQVELSQIGMAAFLGNVTPEQRLEQENLEFRMGELGSQNFGIDGFIEGIPGAVANQVPIQAKTISGTIAGGLAGGAAAAGTAALLGQAGPQAATPEEVVTVPLSFGAGFAFGARATTTVSAALTETQLSFLEFEKITDDAGEKIPREVAQAGALTVGVINGSLEAIGTKTLLKSFPFLRNFGRQGFKKLIQTPGVRQILTTAGKKISQGIATEGITETVQELVQTAGQELLEMASEGEAITPSEFLGRVFSEDNINQALEAGKKGAQAGGGFATAGSVLGAAGDVVKHRQSEKKQTALKKAVEVAKGKDFVKKNPEQAGQLIDQMVADSDSDHVYLPINDWVEYWQSEGGDADQAAIELLGEDNISKYNEAKETGGDIAIPMSKYITSSALSPEHMDNFQDKVKADVDGFSEVETKEFFQKLGEQDKKANEAAQKVQDGESIDLTEVNLTENELERVSIQDNISAQLQAAGRSGPEVDANASLISAGFATLAERTGQGAKELFDKYELTINKSGNKQGQVFDQNGGDNNRGRILISNKDGQKKFNIDLLKAADESTFTHEAGHLYLELLSDLAKEDGARPQLQTDFETILEELGVKDFKEVGVEQHEQFANSFMKYIEEGKAPSSRLQTAFRNFKKWFIGIIKSADASGIELSEDLRQVFDRILATDTEIAKALEDQGFQPLSEDPSALGLTEEEAQRYGDQIAEARLAAEEELASDLIKDFNKEKSAASKKKKAEIEKRVTDEVNVMPVYVAIANMQKGKLPDGSELPGGFDQFKISRDLIDQEYGKEYAKRLPRGITKVGEEGVAPDILAPIFGFNSGDAMVKEIASAESKETLIKKRTEQIFKEENPSLFNSKLNYENAVDAVHNNQRAELLRKELSILSNKSFTTVKGLIRKINKKIPKSDVVRAQAEKIIGLKRVRDIQPLTYRQAEKRNARAASELFLKGDIEGAFESKQKELLNHELYRAAKNARETSDKLVRNLKKYEKKNLRSKLGRAGSDYLAQVDGLLSKYSLKNISGKESDRRRQLSVWAKEQRSLGITLQVPTRLLNEADKVHYKDLSFNDFKDVNDTVESIAYIGLNKEKLIAIGKIREFKEAKIAVLNSIESNHTLKSDDEVKNFDKAGFFNNTLKAGKQFFAKHTKLEFMFEWLDGNKALGPAWQTFFKPFAVAEDQKNIMNREAAEAMNDLFSVYTNKERSDFNSKHTFIEELNSKMTKANLLSLGLNWGNAYNQEAVLEGYGWTREQVETVLENHLDAKDFNFIQSVWTYIDTFWPQVAEQEQKINGIAPKKVEALEIINKHGKFAGGYYPVSFDGDLNYRQFQQDEAASLKDFGGSAVRAMTKRGHTIERVNTGGKPVDLQLNVLGDHIGSVIHDLTHRKAVIDVGRLAADKDIRQFIQKTAGPEMYKQINPWLLGIARDRQSTTGGHFQKTASFLRKGATVVNMGFKITTAAVQPLGFTVSAKELGVEYALKGLGSTFGSSTKTRLNVFRESYEFMNERSEFMRSRLANFDRDVRDAFKKLKVSGTNRGPLADMALEFGFENVSQMLNSGSAKADEAINSYFSLIAYADLAVSFPTWMGAYQKAMDGKVENIKKGNENDAALFADGIVRKTQGSGGPKDLSNMQNGDEIYRLFTMFYSYFSVLFNQFKKTGQDFQKTKNIGQLSSSLILLWFMPLVLEKLALDRGPPPESTEDEQIQFWLSEVLSYPFQTMVGVRDIVNGFGKFGYEPTAAVGAIKAMSTMGSVVAEKSYQALTEGDVEIEKKDVKKVVLGLGYATPFPARQAWLTGEYLWDYMQGDENPENIGEAVYRSLVTKKKD